MIIFLTGTGAALAAFVVIVWSATFVNTKALLADFSALEILALRFAVAWVALWAIHPRGMGPLRRRDEALFAAAGLAGATAYQMLPETAARISCSVELSRAANAARLGRLPNLANLAFLGLLASAFCFVAWNKACERLGTVRCSLGLYLIPVVAFLIAHVFLGETLPAAGVVGAVLVLAGVAVAKDGRAT